MPVSRTISIDPPRRVAVLRALKLGDMLCAVPALRALRTAWPETEITLVGLPWAREFSARFSKYVDRFRDFPGYPGLPEREPDVAAIPPFFAALQAEQFELAIQLHGSGRFVNEIVALFGARHAAGFHLPGDYCPDSTLFVRWPQQGRETRRLLSLVDHLGLPALDERLEFPLQPDDFERLSQLVDSPGLGLCDYAVVHPGASVRERRWPAEDFAAVASGLAERGLAIVLTGVSAEANLVRQIADQSQCRPIDLAGRTDLGTLAALVSEATLVVANDTSISHLAAALQTRSVILSTGDNPARWAPANHRLHRVLANEQGVPVAAVLASADALLSGKPHAAPSECDSHRLAVLSLET